MSHNRIEFAPLAIAAGLSILLWVWIARFVGAVVRGLGA